MELRKTRERQLAFARSGGLHTRVNEAAGNLRSEIRVDPLVDANLSMRHGHKWHRDKDLVNWVKRNHPETAPIEHGDRLSFGYSGGEGLSKPSNRFGRVARRFIPGQGWVELASA